MHVYCEKCGYDSGDRDDSESLAEKVNADGGHMMMGCDENGKPRGWEISCPSGHDDEDIHLD